jgi:hypothetical protein
MSDRFKFAKRGQKRRRRIQEKGSPTTSDKRKRERAISHQQYPVSGTPTTYHEAFQIRSFLKFTRRHGSLIIYAAGGRVCVCMCVRVSRGREF